MPASPPWTEALRLSADPHRSRHFLDQLQSTTAGHRLEQPTTEQARILTSVLAGSQALGECLQAHPDWVDLCLDTDDLQHPRRIEGLRREVRAFLEPLLRENNTAQALALIRLFKQRQTLRIAARDLAGLGPTTEIIREISDVADVCIDAVYQVVRHQAESRYGRPYHRNDQDQWEPTGFCVLGMGKLGGQELNFSSDIDLLFVYLDEGHVYAAPPKRGAVPQGLASHRFFQRLIENFVAELTRLNPEGTLYRVDLRLRPEGENGPLARSLASYENYYAQWGQTWERMMLIKTRCVAGDAALAHEFLEMIQPFRYPRFIPEGVLREIAAMKQRIETEIVRSHELSRNVKLGRGGIREIEFIVQSLQLLQGGRLPFLQHHQTLPALEKLVQYDLLEETDARELTHAYVFLRAVEHRLQMEDNRQTHSIPSDSGAQERLARLMGFSSIPQFEETLARHTTAVRQRYDNLVRTPSPQTELPLPPTFESHEPAWKELLAQHAFKDVDRSLNVLRTFIEGPGYVHVSPRTAELARRLVCELLRHCPRHEPDGQTHWPPQPLSDPDRVLVRLDSYLAAYGSRAMLYETWTSNPALFKLLLLLFDRSEFLAETAIRTPDLVEDLVLSGQLLRRKSAAQILDELRHGAKDQDQLTWIRRYHQAEFMRLGLRDILGLVDFQLNLHELSDLADACLQYALEAVLRQHRRRKPPFAILGLGKLGGSELTYGSDLDIAFVTDARTPNLHRVHKLAAQVMELLSSPTEYGVAFPTDARLRPDGAQGPLVHTLPACEEYYRNRAQLWEIQAISRTRVVAGDQQVGRHFLELAASLADFRQPPARLACYRPDWKAEIAKMRARIEKERTPPGKDALAIKTGAGGLIDAEFIAQALCLTHGWHQPNTLQALQRARDTHTLEPQDAADLLHHYQRLQRIEGILRRWSFIGEVTLPDDPAPLYRVAVRCGYPDANAFLSAVTEHRAALRRVYHRVFPA